MEPAEVYGAALKSSEKLVLLYVLLDSGSAHSYQEIAQACSLSPGHVKRILQGLRRQGWVGANHTPGKACTWTAAGTPTVPPQAPAPEPPARPATAQPQGALGTILEYYRQKFQAVTGKMPFLRRRDTQTLQEMLQTFGAERLRELLDAYFDSQDPFIVNSGWAVGVLASRANSLLMRDPKKPEQKRERYEHLYQN